MKHADEYEKERGRADDDAVSEATPPPLVVGAAHDHFEVDAEARAQRAVAALAAFADRGSESAERIGRSAVPAGAIGADGGQLPDASVARIAAARGAGRPLPAEVTLQYSKALGTDISRARIHEGSDADQLARQMSANAFTVGNDIFFSNGRFDPNSPAGEHVLAHELGHVAQQSSTGTSGAHAPIHRNIEEFTSTNPVSKKPPVAKLIEELQAYSADIQGGMTEVRKRIGNPTVYNPLKNKVQAPTHIEFTMDSYQPRKSPDRGGQQQNVGQMGADEMFIANGQRMIFEGGHIVKNSFWDVTDTDVKMAGSYLNLVPMSRDVNVGGWDSWHIVESQIERYQKSLPDGDSFEIGVDIDYDIGTYFVTLGQIAQQFGLNLTTVKHANDRIVMDRWLTRKITQSGFHLQTGRDIMLDGKVKEKHGRRAHGDIEDGPKLVKVLKDGPIWQRMSPDLQEEVADIE